MNLGLSIGLSPKRPKLGAPPPPPAPAYSEPSMEEEEAYSLPDERGSGRSSGASSSIGGPGGPGGGSIAPSESRRESVFSTGVGDSPAFSTRNDTDDDYSLPTEAYTRAQERLAQPAPSLKKPSWKRELGGALIDTAGVLGTSLGVPLSVSRRVSDRVRYGSQPEEIEQESQDLERALKGADLERGMRTTKAQMEMTREAARSREAVEQSRSGAKITTAGIQAGQKAADRASKYDRDPNLRWLQGDTDEPDYDAGESLVVDREAGGKRFAKLGTAGKITKQATSRVDAESIPTPDWLKKDFPNRPTITSREMHQANRKFVEQMKQSGANVRAAQAEGGKSARHSANRADRKSRSTELINLYRAETELNSRIAGVEKMNQDAALPGQDIEEFKASQKELADLRAQIAARRKQVEAEMEAEEARGDGTGSTLKGGKRPVPGTTPPAPTADTSDPSAPPVEAFKSGKEVSPGVWHIQGKKSGAVWEYDSKTGQRKKVK